MMTKELILQEIESMPEATLVEVLDFVRSLKTKQVEASPHITVVTPTGESVVPLESLPLVLPGRPSSDQPEPVSIAQVRQDLQEALVRSGYDSKEAIAALLRDVKQEMLIERESR